MPIPKKIILFRDQTQCYPVDEDGKVWHIWGGPFGPLCEIIFDNRGNDPELEDRDIPLLVFQNNADYIGMGPTEFGYHMWSDRRTQDGWDSIPDEFEGLAFIARRFGLKLENPHHRVAGALMADLVESGLLTPTGIPEEVASEMIQRWLGKIIDALES